MTSSWYEELYEGGTRGRGRWVQWVIPYFFKSKCEEVEGVEVERMKGERLHTNNIHTHTN